jgi:hypothetical protein
MGRTPMFKSITAAVFLFAFPALQSGADPASLALVKRLALGSMGQSDEAERFRLLLEAELGKAGFATTSDEKAADAVLTGALSVRVYEDGAVARVTVVLKTLDGVHLWSQDFQPRFKIGGTSDSVKLRAQDVAKALMKEKKKAAVKAVKH